MDNHGKLNGLRVECEHKDADGLKCREQAEFFEIGSLQYLCARHYRLALGIDRAYDRIMRWLEPKPKREAKGKRK